MLLYKEDLMLVKSTEYIGLGSGYYPLKRPIKEYLKYGIVLIDKPSNPSSHEVVTWVKKIFNADKTGHAGTLDPKVSGVLNICLNRATRLTKAQSDLGKTYICEIEFNDNIESMGFDKILKNFIGHQFQRPPKMCAVKRDLRLRWIYELKLIEVNINKALFEVKCEAGTYIRSLCTHLGLFVGIPAKMTDLRRIKSGSIDESMVCTLHDLKDAMHLYNKTKDESVLRKIVFPLEMLLLEYPRIMIKDTAVSAITHGSPLMIGGILKYDESIIVNRICVLITAKGEAVALAKPLLDAKQIKDATKGIVANTERVILEKDLYKKCWGGKEFEILD